MANVTSDDLAAWEEQGLVIDWEAMYAGNGVQFVGTQTATSSPDVSEVPQAQIEDL